MYTNKYTSYERGSWMINMDMVAGMAVGRWTFPRPFGGKLFGSADFSRWNSQRARRAGTYGGRAFGFLNENSWVEPPSVGRRSNGLVQQISAWSPNTIAMLQRHGIVKSFRCFNLAYKIYLASIWYHLCFVNLIWMRTAHCIEEEWPRCQNHHRLQTTIWITSWFGVWLSQICFVSWAECEHTESWKRGRK